MSFTPRLTRPEAGNKYYIRKAQGGYSNAILGKPTDKDCNVLSNCVGYAYGRFNEIGGYGYCKYLLPVNAENFIERCGGLPVGQTPKLGACMVWQKGATLKDEDGAGHVAIVEKIIDENTIITSESGYGYLPAFFTKTRKRGTDGNWGQNSNYKFRGFIYNPAVKDESPVVVTIKVGDIVNFTGTVHYTNANAPSGYSCKPGRAKVTQIYSAGKHPYHLVRVAGESSTVYGWVDSADIVETNTPKWEPAVGDIVTYYGTVHYTNSYSSGKEKNCKPGKAKITQINKNGAHPYLLKATLGGGSNVYGWVDAGTFKKE